MASAASSTGSAAATPATRPDEEQALIVVVRAPNQETQDFRVECPRSWTVLRLKEHLQNSYQGNPVPSDQKLIYSGQLLDDTSFLREVLRQDGSCSQHTVHLVCRPPQGGAAERSAAGRGQAAPVPANGAPAVSGTNATAASPSSALPSTSSQESNNGTQQRVFGTTVITSDGHPNELRYRGPTIQCEVAAASAEAYTAHVLALQSMYAQYYQQLLVHQQALLSGTSPASSIHYSFNPQAFQSVQQQQQLLARMATSLINNNNNNNNNNNIVVAPQAARQIINNNNINNDNNNNNRVNNPPANDEDARGAWGGAGAGRDWLDVIYVAIRAAMLVTFIYFYSSLERFILVTGLGMLLYLYQQGFLGLPNVQPQAAPPPQPQQQQQQQQQPQQVPVYQPPPVPQARQPQPPAGAGRQQQPQQDQPAPTAPVVPDHRDGAQVDNNNPAAQQQRDDIERLQAAMDGEDPRAVGGDAAALSGASSAPAGPPPQSALSAAASLLRAFLVSLIPDNNH